MQAKTLRENEKGVLAKGREQPLPHHGGGPIKSKHLMEVRIEKDDPNALLYCQRAPVLILHVGSHFIEVTATSLETDAAAWVAETLQVQRGLRRAGTPLLVGLCAFKGLPEGRAVLEKGRTNPNHPLNPYRVIAICLGGSRVLFYRLSGPKFSMKPLLHLLENTRSVVVGLGIRETAHRLQNQSGLMIKRVVDLRDLMAHAYRKRGALMWPLNTEQNLEGLSINLLGLTEMATLALDGARLEKMPSKVILADWGRESDFLEEEREMELIKYAARDAFLSYEIAARCIQATGGLTSIIATGYKTRA